MIEYIDCNYVIINNVILEVLKQEIQVVAGEKIYFAIDLEGDYDTVETSNNLGSRGHIRKISGNVKINLEEQEIIHIYFSNGMQEGKYKVVHIFSGGYNIGLVKVNENSLIGKSDCYYTGMRRSRKAVYKSREIIDNSLTMEDIVWRTLISIVSFEGTEKFIIERDYYNAFHTYKKIFKLEDSSDIWFSFSWSDDNSCSFNISRLHITGESKKFHNFNQINFETFDYNQKEYKALVVETGLKREFAAVIYQLIQAFRLAGDQCNYSVISSQERKCLFIKEPFKIVMII